MAELRPHLLQEPGELASLIGELRDVPHLAVDTEFHRERTYFAQLALVQLGWDERQVLIDPLAVDITPLAEVFAGDTVVVMHAARQDLEIFERACGLIPRHLVDTQLAAGFVGYTSPSLASLVERELGARIPKADRLTDWLRRPLSDAQLTYAAADVAYLVEVWQRLERRLDERGRRAWFDEATAEMLDEPRGARDPDGAWRRIKELRHLRGRDLATARALAAWREQRAIEMDLTPRYVLSDLGLVGVAMAKPTSVEELRSVRGVDGRALKPSTAAELIDVVRGAANSPVRTERQSTVRELPAELKPALPLVSAWVSQLARDLGIEPALLATRADLEELLRDEPGARLATGWRDEVVGSPIRRLVSGEVAIRFDRGHGLVLEGIRHPA